MRPFLYTILFLLLVAAVPWLFPEGSTARLGGFPAWAVYSVAMAVIYATVVSTFVWRFWDAAGDDSDDEKKP